MDASSYMLLYGALVAVAGVIGAITSGSAISAVSGVIFGALAIVAGFGLRRPTARARWARPLGFAVSGFLLLFFASRMLQESLFPALIVALLSLLALVVLFRVTPSALPSTERKQAPDSRV